MRRILTCVVGGAVVTFSGMTTPPPAIGQSVVSPNDVELVVSRPPRSRSGVSRPAVRQYRSYSIAPGDTEVPESAAPAVGGGPVFTPAPPATDAFQPAAPRSSRSSKPSFMRADSKARGQFNR